MDNNYRQALTEVLEVLNHSEKELIQKLPTDFIKFIFENMDKSYVPNIDFNLADWEIYLKPEAQAMLSYIYKEYFVTLEEKATLLMEADLIQKGEEMLAKCGIEELFQNNKAEDPAINPLPVEAKTKPWYKRAFEKLLQLFK